MVSGISNTISGLLQCSIMSYLILFYVHQAIGMRPPIAMPQPVSVISRVVPQFVKSYFYTETDTVLQKLFDGELGIDDPSVQSRMRKMPLMCTSQALQFLLDKGVIFNPDMALRLAIGDRCPSYYLPNRFENLKILLKAGYKLDIKHDWQKKVIFYLCFYQSKEDCPSDRPKVTGDLGLYSIISRLVRCGSANPNAKSTEGQTVLSDIIKRLYPGAFDYMEDQHFIRPERKFPIIKVLWVNGANQISENCRKRLEERKPEVLSQLNSLDLNKAAIFQAVKDRNSEALKRLACCLPFLVKNADGDNPLHFAVRKAVDGPGEERDKSLEIIGIILRILPQLLLETTTSEPKCTPIIMIIGFKRSLLPLLHKLCEGKKTNEPKPTQAS